MVEFPRLSLMTVCCCLLIDCGVGVSVILLKCALRSFDISCHVCVYWKIASRLRGGGVDKHGVGLVCYAKERCCWCGVVGCVKHSSRG